MATSARGPGLSADSVIYLEGARYLAADGEFSAHTMHGDRFPVVHWPPLFSFLLSLFVQAGLDPTEGGRWLNALAHGGTAALAGWSAWRLTAKPLAGACAAWLYACAPGALFSACWIWSESLFTLLALGCAVSLAGALRTGKARWLILSAVLAGLACLQRYAGLFLLGAVPAAVLLFGTGNWKARSRLAGLWLPLAALPHVAWSLRNKLATGQASTRALDVHGIPWGHWKDCASTLSKWLLPPEVPWQVRGAVLLLACTVLAAAAGVAIHTWVRRRAWPFGAFCMAFCGAYVALVLLTIALFDRTTPLDDRMLSPLVAGLALAAGAAFARPPVAWVLAVRVLIVLLMLAFGIRVHGVVTVARGGLGYSAPVWSESPLARAVRALPADTRIWSNRPDVLRLGRDSELRSLPTTHHADALRAEEWPRDDRYEARARKLQDELRDADGRVAYFRCGWEFYAPLEQTLIDLDLEVEHEFPDGWMLKPRAKPAHP
ncbi:MAG: glycosyltransferase family 39 protein [Planctomycetes bacterium]|nr:glycosyltransferase family 39 protein [Planctomycetota bacterium]